MANEACDAAHISVNGRQAKASYDVKVGDIIEVTFGQRTLKVRVLLRSIKEILCFPRTASIYASAIVLVAKATNTIYAELPLVMISPRKAMRRLPWR